MVLHRPFEPAPFIGSWKENRRVPVKNQANEQLDRSSKLHAEVDRPSLHLGRKLRLHPTGCLFVCSISAVVDLRQSQSRVRVVQQRCDSHPSTARFSCQTAAPIQANQVWNNPSAGSAPTPQTHGYAEWSFALGPLGLRRPPADMLVMLEKATKRCALLQMRH